MLSSFIIFPFISIIVLNLPFTKNLHRVAFAWALILFTAQVLLSCFLPLTKVLHAATSPGYLFQFSLSLDNLSILMLFCIGVVLAAAAVMGKQFIKEQKQQFNFINLLLFVFTGTNGVVLVNDIFSLYIFLEITAVASYILVAFDKDLKALSAAFKYIILSVAATILMLLAIALLVFIAGDTDFNTISHALRHTWQGSFMAFAIGLFLCGLFIKAGVVPFHGWLPDAYTLAPPAASVLLAGIVTKVLGVYTLIRLVAGVFVVDVSINYILLVLGMVSVILGALMALGQNDFKRMLAYSSISQIGYMLLGLGAGTPLGVAGSVFHLFNHAIFKTLLFVNSAVLEKQLGTRDMRKLGGLGKSMPVTALSATLASLSAAGLPPLAGFWSKLLIIIALWLSGHYIYAGLASVAGVLTLGYFLMMQRKVFFGKPRQDLANAHEANSSFSVIQIILALITLGAGLAFPFMLNNFILPLEAIVGKG